MAKAKSTGAAKAAKRDILCPRCERQFQVGVSTQSTICPGCNKRVRTADEKIKSYYGHQELFIEGKVEITKKGNVSAEVRVRELIVAGEIRGAVRARESVLIDKTGRIFGNVTTPSLTVKNGGCLVGYCVIGVPPEQDPAAILDAEIGAAAQAV